MSLEYFLLGFSVVVIIVLFVGGLVEFIFDRYDETFDLDTEIKRENNEK